MMKIKRFNELMSDVNVDTTQKNKTKLGDGTETDVISSDNLNGDKYEVEFDDNKVNIFLSAVGGVVTMKTKINGKYTEIDVKNENGTYIFSDNTDFMFSNMQGVGILTRMNVRQVLDSLSNYYKNKVTSKDNFVMYTDEDGYTCISKIEEITNELEENKLISSIGDSELIYHFDTNTIEVFEISFCDKRNKRAYLKMLSEIIIDKEKFDKIEVEILTNKKIK